ncbi:TetR family transcriptional regulator [Amycolatopsis endophytica]|uniref:AcrR family transcriptional regulator n=1 Tax=Amycolatopsis endophytica TaxID=860233 RepID=A0A853BB75_9PSEU|nr:TetR/AcrR family transcriptional regulator [Amycolatopsis endophytica]NYI91937.1 AcrR family transcriptional regulator [Amycolatopsis endophytica]
MPTGVHIRDARRQLFDAAERILLREGPAALTSRAVTAEAGCAKGVLHRHFADFDDFLAELVRERVARLEDQAAALHGTAGTGSVIANLTDALIELFDPVAVGVVGLVIFRDELRARLRQAWPGIPVLTEAAAMIAAYLTDECELGRLAADTDAGSLALALIGSGHLLFADRASGPPGFAAVEQVVSAVLADVVGRRLL